MLIIIYDTETTGFPKNSAPLDQQPKIIEFAAIKLDSITLEEVGRIEFLANPGAPLPSIITQITGITDAMVGAAPPFIENFEKLTEFFTGANYIAAHNLSFDKKMINFEIERAGKTHLFPWPANEFCTMLSATSMNGGKWPKLKALYFMLFNEDFAEAHRAMNDVMATTRIVKELIKRGIFKLPQLEIENPILAEVECQTTL